MYSKNEPKYHIIYGGGINQVEQARQTEGGNELFIYNMMDQKVLSKFGVQYGRINWISSFPDGSGVITAGEEGVVRIYRFDQTYY